MDKKKQITFLIDIETHAKLKETARKKGLIFSRYVANLVIKALQEELNDN